jgi:wyosine [tRNA(Phe)-imidazoG37] synthetase (radical SAM superfamily)
MKKEHDMNSQVLTEPTAAPSLAPKSSASLLKPVNAFAQPRDFLENRFVYFTLSPRARGLSIGVNLTPNRKCNFDCVYCEVDRTQPVHDEEIDCDVASLELQRALKLVHSGVLRQLPPYNQAPEELLKLRHVALSGDGEPTLSPKFLDAVEAVVHVRALGQFPFFKIVLITNSSGLDLPHVQTGLTLLTSRDEVWAKLDVGSQRMFDTINRGDVSLEKILNNILLTARKRPVIIQSLFCQIGQTVPSVTDIEEYAAQLRRLKEAGAQIPLVQIYSASRPTPHSNVRHLPLKSLAAIAETVRRSAGLAAEPF